MPLPFQHAWSYRPVKLISGDVYACMLTVALLVVQLSIAATLYGYQLLTLRVVCIHVRIIQFDTFTKVVYVLQYSAKM